MFEAGLDWKFRYTRRNIKFTYRHMNLELKGDGWIEDTNLTIIRLQVIFKTMRVNETIQEKMEESEEEGTVD